MRKSDDQAALEFAQTLLQNELNGDEPLTVSGIAAVLDRVLAMNPRWQTSVDREGVLRELETRFSVWIGRTRVLEDNSDHEAWLTEDRKSGWRLWPRYRQYLEQTWAPAAIGGLEDATDDILGRLEDPARPGVWDRRGLVVGHVQSGKTSNYTGLICKAADAGYKVVIVLAGIHKNLRSQTQMRLDEGFLGYETSPQRDPTALASIGVGLIDSDHAIRPDYVTNRADNGDFRLAAAQHMGISPGGRPLLFVVKKNKTVLKNIISWVDGLLNGRTAMDVPLLLVDDEADHASVDTREMAVDEDGRPDPEHAPAVINGLIRSLLKRFDRSAYVGYTATPFANIFIHDGARTEAEGEDLFPRSFIINLPAASNYDGPVRIFGLEPSSDDPAGQPGLPLVRIIRDHAASDSPDERNGWMPPVHRNGFTVLHEGSAQVPPSLREAILAFLLTCAARRVRGQVAVHNSMLVHVTRFTSVQRQVRDQVEKELAAIVNRLRLGRGGDEVRHELRALWERDFLPTTEQVAAVLPERTFTPVTWEEVDAVLPSVAADIHVKEINGSARDVLDYEVHRATGFNVIAIGGDKLARGLTLEGLSVSYFLRAARMYDTLMQMGRWFGFRPGYLDLCRLYTTSDLEEWFGHVTEASEELRREFDHMHAVGGSPKDYGLRVRAHPTLMVTSRVKMRNSTTLDLIFSGALQETVVFHRDAGVLNGNLELTEAFLRSLGPTPQGVRQDRPSGTSHDWEAARRWTSVPGEQVADYLERYATHPTAVRMNARLLADYTRMQLADGCLTHWDVVLLGGSVEPAVPVAGLATPLVLRSLNPRIPLTQQKAEGRVVIRRLLAPRDEAIDLDATAWAKALRITIDDFEADAGRSPRRRSAPDSPSGPALRRVRGQLAPERGLLLIYPLTTADWDLKGHARPAIGIGVSFPETAGARPVRYSVNNIYWDQEYGEVA